MVMLSGAMLVAYEPLGDEVDFRNCPFLKRSVIDFVIGQDKNSDPFAIATRLTQEFQNKKVSILIPGQRFDRHGTRHGRGNGWYDRLLSRVPQEWTRIGVMRASQLHETLERAAHDEVMDILWIFDGKQWATLETKARC